MLNTPSQVLYPLCHIPLLRVLEQHPVDLLEPLSQGPYTVFFRHCANCLIAVLTHNNFIEGPTGPGITVVATHVLILMWVPAHAFPATPLSVRHASLTMA